jgi:hypothetical protein
MDLVELYYGMIGGYPSDNEENKIKSQNIIDYLKDCNIPEREIVTFICTAPVADKLSPTMLPDELWNNSFLKRDKFYYHNILHLTSAPPTWNPVTGVEKIVPFYLEMKILFTMQDIIRYFYKKMYIDTELIDVKKDTGSFNFLLGRYEKFKFVEPIDYLLAVIDHASRLDEERRIRSVLDIQQYEGEVFDMLQRKVAEASLAKANVIIWR